MKLYIAYAIGSISMTNQMCTELWSPNITSLFNFRFLFVFRMTSLKKWQIDGDKNDNEIPFF